MRKLSAKILFRGTPEISDRGRGEIALLLSPTTMLRACLQVSPVRSAQNENTKSFSKTHVVAVV